MSVKSQELLETDLRKTSHVESKHTINESGMRANLAKKVPDDSQNGGTRRKLNEDSEHESKKSYSGENIKDAELWFRANEKGDRNGKKSDEVHSRKEKKDDRNGSKEKKKERSSRTGEKSMESESRKRSYLNMEEDRKESEKLHSSNAKEDDNRKTGRKKDKEEDRARHKSANDSRRHKRRRSSSTSRSRNSKDRELSHEGSDDSKRKTHSKRRNLSPSPVRSRRSVCFTSDLLSMFTRCMTCAGTWIEFPFFSSL
ncbi:uncharacterized protein LOC126654645 isoform X2 [Mercurialis annua]|uniref:uncharacterized protein LOC126654645 isoform X2 n=1 Tax=Mercurialis annua TaxID=3986 RepID=UPI0021608EEC|nr:uncharacterized protein LOC126654645 isoform X2 [Mercurialis annua]